MIAAGQLDQRTLTRLATGLPPVVAPSVKALDSGLSPESWHDEVRRLEAHLASVAQDLRSRGALRA